MKPSVDSIFSVVGSEDNKLIMQLLQQTSVIPESNLSSRDGNRWDFIDTIAFHCFAYWSFFLLIPFFLMLLLVPSFQQHRCMSLTLLFCSAQLSEKCDGILKRHRSALRHLFLMDQTTWNKFLMVSALNSYPYLQDVVVFLKM